MCIIVAKKKEVELPKIEYLENCFDFNNDGAGFMYVDRGKVVIDKGYMKFKDFKHQYEKLCKRFNNFKNKALVMHFRIGTSGTNSRENTHPYCISNDYKELHKTKIVTDLGVVHNGIIHNYTPSDTKNKHNTNDTQEFIMRYLYPLYTNWKDFYKNEYILEGIGDITGSKFTFLNTKEELYFVGEFVEDKGVMYSNNSYNYGKSYYYGTSSYKWEPTWDTSTRNYLTSVAKMFDKGKEVEEKEVEVENLLKLEPTWYVGDGYNISKVGTRDLYVDWYTYTLYEMKENNTLFEIGTNVWVYDENYEEVI